MTVAGLVLVRQRPGSASGVIFATLEDETGVANLVIWNRVFERHRKSVLRASLLLAEGKLQREGLVIHVVADRLVDLSEQLEALRDRPRELEATPFANTLARADEVKRPGHDHRERAAPQGSPVPRFGHPRHEPVARGRLFKSRDFH